MHRAAVVHRRLLRRLDFLGGVILEDKGTLVDGRTFTIAKRSGQGTAGAYVIRASYDTCCIVFCQESECEKIGIHNPSRFDFGSSGGDLIITEKATTPGVRLFVGAIY